MKKRLCILLLGLVIATTPAMSVMAEETSSTVTTGTMNDALEDETDVDEDIREEIEAEIPDEIEEIRISTAEEFMDFAAKCSLDIWSVNKKVILMNDISLIGYSFTGIPTFGGTFDGMGHTISDLNIRDGVSYAGLFCNTQKTAVISNLKVSATVIPSGNQIVIGGIVGDNAGLISDCSFDGIVSGSDYVGAIVGINELTGDIRNCTNSGYINGTHFTGGIAGENMGNIYGCTNSALVNTTNTDTQITVDAMQALNTVLAIIKNGNSSSESANADVTVTDTGGIAGLSLGIIRRCVNNGDVGYEHVGYNVGGIVGRQSGYVYRCTNNAFIQGRKDVGGIVGQAEPYITVDLSSDVAYQLTEAISKLHDIVTVTLNDTRNQSDVISNRLSAIQQFTSKAIDDVRYIANGTVEYANGVSGAATEAFSRVDYILEESSKSGGVIDNAESAAKNVSKSAGELVDAVNDLELEQYMDDTDKRTYQTAKDTLSSIRSQSNYLTQDYYNSDESKYRYNTYIVYHRDDSTDTSDLKYYDENDVEIADPTTSSSGTWKHSTDMTTFPVSSSDSRYDADIALYNSAQSDVASAAETYVKENYTSPVDGVKGIVDPTAVEQEYAYDRDLRNASADMTVLVERYSQYAADAARADASKAMNSLDAASDNLQNATTGTKSIINNLAGRDDISFPQFSAEYKAHTTSLADNMQGMNDNFGLLNTDVNNATGILVDDLQAMNDQFNTIMLLYTDAIDGVLEMDYTAAFDDVSFDEAETCTDATIDSCLNYGIVEGDIDSSGIAGTMAIEYDFDKESDVTGITDSKLNSSYLTKCVLRGNKNYADAISEKSYAGGICGLQEMGTIIYCFNTGNIKSASGEYVGGVVGSSLSYVVGSESKGILTGSTYVGGIAGDGTHISDCTTIVKIQDAENWYGAIAGHVSEEGVVRNNYFVSDELAGINNVSYSLKAEPVEYDSSVLSREFGHLTISFVLSDEEDQLIKKISRSFGSSLKETDYPEVDEKEGYYIVWSQDSIDKVMTDQVITATYVKYRTTIAEADPDSKQHQSELLVDGEFKEDDALQVDKEVFLDKDILEDVVKNDLRNNVDYEKIHLVIPDDGQSIHQIRYKPESDYATKVEGYELYLVNGDSEELIATTGKMGEYDTYNLSGNDVVLVVRFKGIATRYYKYFIICLILFLVLIAILVITFIVIHRHKDKLPKAINKIAKNVSEKIESKEQIFYDENAHHEEEKDDTEKEEAGEVEETEAGGSDPEESVDKE